MSDCNSQHVERISRGMIGSVLFVGFVIRLAIGFAMQSGLEADPDGYRSIAANLSATNVYGLLDTRTGQVSPTAHRPPLYPVILAIIGGSNSGVIILHAACGALTVLWTLLICRRVVPVRYACLAAVAILFDPILLKQSSLVMTETIATALAAGILWGMFRALELPSNGRLLTLGGLFGLSVLCRPTFAAWLACGGLLLIVMLIRKAMRHVVSSPGRKPDRAIGLQPFSRSNRLSKSFVIVAGTTGLVVAPWVARNWFSMGAPILFTTHGGYTLLLGNNPHYYQYLRSNDLGNAWTAADFHREQAEAARDMADAETEREADRRNYASAYQYIREDKFGFLVASQHRLRRFWGAVPKRISTSQSTLRTIARYGVGVWYVVIFVLAAVGTLLMIRRRHWQIVLVLLMPCLAFSLVHTVYWSDMRMRAPITVAICVLAALGLVSCFRANLRIESRESDSYNPPP